MMISGEAHYGNGDSSLFRQPDTVVDERNVDGSPKGTIPNRYRDGLGGINLEQVRQDQRQARRDVVRGMLRRLLNLRRRH
ncbi:hypothetical protein [Marinobacter salicampi]|uniref:hypothetical protein n=1 Tax=Marinobacter salicampi TaxID=435907 RepID=UPI00140A94D0|nr:hypothetical protein [Marinobacter salicampi]